MSVAQGVNVMIGSMVAGAFSAYESQKAQNEQARYNANVLRQEAQQTRELGKQKLARHRQKASSEEGLLRARQGLYGFAGEGSGGEQIADLYGQSEVDAMIITAEAENQARSLLSQAELERTKKASPGGAAFQSLLSSAGRLGSVFTPGGGGPKTTSNVGSMGSLDLPQATEFLA